MRTYQTHFHLHSMVTDIVEAQRYLDSDNMLDYFDNNDIKNKLVSIKWILTDEQNGKIVVKSNTPLTELELIEISHFISGQNSDGLGEGFSQQDFACTFNEELFTGSNYEDAYTIASFDWETNNYLLTEVFE